MLSAFVQYCCRLECELRRRTRAGTASADALQVVVRPSTGNSRFLKGAPLPQFLAGNSGQRRGGWTVTGSRARRTAPGRPYRSGGACAAVASRPVPAAPRLSGMGWFWWVGRRGNSSCVGSERPLFSFNVLYSTVVCLSDCLGAHGI